MTNWIQGPPTVEQVAQHEKEHPACVRKAGPLAGEIRCSWAQHLHVDNRDSCGNWIVHHGQDFKPDYDLMGGLLSLRVVSDAVAFWNPSGAGFWQLLSTARWAETSRYFPVGADGLPVYHGHSFCSYCGELTKLEGLNDEQRSNALLDHILACDKRPELKFVKIALAAQEVLDQFDSADTPDRWRQFGEALATLRERLDGLMVSAEQPKG